MCLKCARYNARQYFSQIKKMKKKFKMVFYRFNKDKFVTALKYLPVQNRWIYYVIFKTLFTE